MPGGTMEGCPWLKAVLVRTAAFTLHHFAALPTKDPTSGFRMFSRRVIDQIEIESRSGILLQHRIAGESPPAGLAHRRGSGALVRTPAWREPVSVLKWLPAYLRWFRYAFATTYLRRSPETVLMQSKPARTA
jgi:dolichol-phosphate mannosyltransferase